MPTKAFTWIMSICLGVLAFAQDEMKLSLEEALKTAVERNLDIQLQRVNLETSAISLEDTFIQYEPVLTSAFSTSSRTNEAQDRTEGASGTTYEDESTSLNTSLRKSHNWGMDWTVSFNNSFTQSGRSFSLGDTYGSSLNLSVTQKLLSGFSLDEEIRRNQEYVARGNLAIARNDLENQLQSIVEQTENAYWDLVYSIEDLKVKQQSLRLAQQLYEQNKIKIEVGTLASIDLVQTESEMASREADIVTAENAIRAAEDRLKLALNLPVESWTDKIVPTQPFEVSEKATDLNKDLGTALANRPEMKSNQISIDNALLTRKVRENEKKPELNVTAGYGAGGASVPIGIDTNGDGETDITQPAAYESALNKVLFQDLPGWNVRLDLTWRPFNKQANANMSRANADLRRAELEVERTKLNILNDVRTAGRELQANWKSIKANEKNVKYQRENVKAENQKFQNGLSTNYEVSQAQNNLATAESQLLSSKISYMKALVGYRKALGLLLKEHNINVD